MTWRKSRLSRRSCGSPVRRRVNPTPMAVYELSQQAEVHMAVAAGRVRYEHNNYRLLSQFVGRGEVGRLFEGA